MALASTSPISEVTPHMSTSTLRPSRSLHAVAALALVLFAAGCAKSEAPAASRSAPLAAASAASGPPVLPAEAMNGAPGGGSGRPSLAARALVVTVELTMTAKNPDLVSAQLREQVERAGGFVADASASGSAELRSVRLVLRVPADRTKSLRAAMADLGKITTDTEKSEDVTEQRADLDARLGNARAQEKRLVEIMAHKTGSISDVLEVEKELARVRETVERYDAQKRTLDGKIDLATVTVSIGTPTTVTPEVEVGALAKIAHAFRGGVQASGTLLLWGAMAFAAAAPILVPIGSLLALVIVIARRRRLAQIAAMRAVS